jgi:quercetin 2,3-dioxygenase
VSLDQSASENSTNPFAGILPGQPAPFFLDQGEGEKSVVFDTLFTILLSGDETDGQYGAFTTEGPAGEMIPPHMHPYTHEIFFCIEGEVRLWLDDEKGFKAQRLLERGGFAFIPAGTIHAFRLEAPTRVFGVSTGGFERFFHGIGKPTDKPGIPAPEDFYVPSREQFETAGEKYGTVFRPDFVFDV